MANCDQFRDIQNWTDDNIAEEMLNFKNAEKIFVPINGYQLAKMKKSIPDMSLP